MAKPGPTAKPVELKLLEGNRGHRAQNLSETFRPEVGLPSVPKDLSPGARKVWKRLATELLRYNLMSAVYGDLFEDLCETVAQVKEIRHSLNARKALLRNENKDPSNALVSYTPTGIEIQRGLYQIFKSERQMMHSLLAKFGLSPAEQASVTTAIRAQLKLFEGDGQEKPKAAPTPTGKPNSFADFE